MVFDKVWFQKYQMFLLWFANTKYGKSVLGIDGSKSDLSGKIIKIMPNHIIWRVSGNQFATEFRTHEKFGKRLYYEYKKIWKAFHWFDDRTANYPQLNLGFDTLTQYPDAGTGNTTVDGYVGRYDAGGNTWASIHDGAGTQAIDITAQTNFARITATATNWQYIYRGIFLFDTSSLGAEATVDSAVLSLYATFLSKVLSTFGTAVYTSNPASNNDLVVGDYANLGSAVQSNVLAYGDLSTGVYNDYTLTAAGKGNVSLTDISKFGLRNKEYDGDDSEPSHVNGSNYMYGYHADQAGTSTDPKLVVTYTSGAAGLGVGGLALGGAGI